ncbi:NAD(P)H-hydrate epimerase [Silicimonas algicola]|uniref:Multifunctional fusion protein n=1 Tax=Silicimonas algicola TaxID=1826607 RepID=A0A316GCD5_9RHOB|nr:NAD(P)H-hydrate epimerase [Silicimonas algicola]PWK58263.1 hydroxyethylthiazole kinase-like uncharacterized protein yjeF [Silicimonas algicola]
MTELLTAAQMRAIEQAAIASGEVTGLELMERAGRGVVEAIFEEWPELATTSHKAVVLCGPGNNGGDGFVVARLLKEWGWEVEVFLYGDPEKLPPDAKVNYERWGELGETFAFSGTFYHPERRVAYPDVFFDALFGIGLTRPVDLGEEYADTAESVPGDGLRGNLRHVAIDIPSGLCSDSGKVLGAPFLADMTVTFHGFKHGHLLDFGPTLSGKVICKDIGLPAGVGSGAFGNFPYSDRVTSAFDRELQFDQVMRLAKTRVKTPHDDVHKYTHGHALILSGGPGKTGAARLAARGALRIGAGLVTVGCPQTALWEVASQVTAIMCRPLDGAPGLTEALEDERINALCLGPGLGLGADTQALVLAALKATAPRGPGSSPGQDRSEHNPAAPAPEPGPRPTSTAAPAPEPGPRPASTTPPAPEPGPRPARAVVLDADALTRFERNPQVLFDALHQGCVLTPHAGEFKRLFPDIAEKLDAPATTGPAYSKVDATREAAKRAGCTILFKGPDTVIAHPSGQCSINSSAYERAAPWLATAGSGDVLSGMITGLLARGLHPFDAAGTAAWLHTECALSFGPGLIAEDIPEELPKVFRALGL